MRPGRGQRALGREQILDRERDALEQAGLTGRQPAVGRIRHRPRLLGRLGDEGVEAACRCHGLLMGFGQFTRRELPARQRRAGGGERQAGRLGHHSTTLGTTK
jgi:hypothetical protein